MDADTFSYKFWFYNKNVGRIYTDLFSNNTDTLVICLRMTENQPT